MPEKQYPIDPDKLGQEISHAVERVRKRFRDMPQEESADEEPKEEPRNQEK